MLKHKDNCENLKRPARRKTVPNLKRVIWIVRLMLFGAPMALLFSKPDLIIDAKELEKILSLSMSS
jgi:hypothetical protein